MSRRALKWVALVLLAELVLALSPLLIVALGAD